MNRIFKSNPWKHTYVLGEKYRYIKQIKHKKNKNQNHLTSALSLKWPMRKILSGQKFFFFFSTLIKYTIIFMNIWSSINFRKDYAHNIYLIIKYGLSMLLSCGRCSLFQLHSQWAWLIIHLLDYNFNKVYNKLVPTDNINYSIF